MEACGSVSMSWKENKQLKLVFVMNVQKQRPFILFFLSLIRRNVEGSRDRPVRLSVIRLLMLTSRRAFLSLVRKKQNDSLTDGGAGVAFQVLSREEAAEEEWGGAEDAETTS